MVLYCYPVLLPVVVENIVVADNTAAVAVVAHTAVVDHNTPAEKME